MMPFFIFFFWWCGFSAVVYVSVSQNAVFLFNNDLAKTCTTVLVFNVGKVIFFN